MDERSLRSSSHAGQTVGTDVAPPASVRAAVPEYQLEMPVELWFGEERIGVKSGSPTCEEFRRFADALLAQYRAARRVSG